MNMTDSGARPRVLYIDDDPGIARLVQRGLERAGFAVTTETDPACGERLARQGGFACIALDHYMPGLDGLELLERLGDLPGLPPVIFVTGAEETRIAVAALKRGAADYVVKDVRGEFIELLGGSIRQEIARARLMHERDAAEREVRESRDRLARLAEQQQVLLREVNHRVANSLQLISSLIAMQARRVPDGSARAVLHQAVKRVDAVMLVHRRLYSGSDVEFVEMGAYLGGLVEELSGMMRDSEAGPRIELSAEKLRVETDKAVPLGLIVNELVTNAVKYAYPNGAAGAVRVRLARGAENSLSLCVEDDGVGMPEDGAKPEGSGLGSLIVRSMVQALHGRLERDPNHKGTRFLVWVETTA